jgi:hypothetical protein
VTCHFCSEPIQPGDAINQHHPTYKSQGGTETAPAHESCHVEYHSEQGDFKQWGRAGGKLSALTRRWALNLRGVKDHPAYDTDRSFYLACYSH